MSDNAAIREPMLVVLVLASGCLDAPPDPRDEALQAAIQAGEWASAPAVERPDHNPLETRPDALSESLGAWRYEATMTLRYVGDDGTEETFLEEKVTLTQSKAGPYALKVRKRWRRVDDPPGESGRDAVFDGERFYTKLGAGDWIRRDLLRRDHLRWRLEATRHLEVLTRLAAPATLEGDDALSNKGRSNGSSRVILYSLGPHKPPGLLAGQTLDDLARDDGGPDWFAWWRNVHQPTRLEGRVVLDDDVDVVRTATMLFEAKTTKLKAPREDTAGPEPEPKDRRFGVTAETIRAAEEAAPEPIKPAAPVKAVARLKATLDLRIQKLDAEPTIESPDESEVLDIRRPRVHHMIRNILGDRLEDNRENKQ